MKLSSILFKKNTGLKPRSLRLSVRINRRRIPFILLLSPREGIKVFTRSKNRYYYSYDFDEPSLFKQLRLKGKTGRTNWRFREKKSRQITYFMKDWRRL